MRGGKREGAGRPPGAKNKATAEIKALAQEYGPRAIERLAQIMLSEDVPPQACVAAAREILDRGHGKALQTTDLTSSDGSMRPQGYAVIPELAKGMKEWTETLSSLPPEE